MISWINGLGGGGVLVRVSVCSSIFWGSVSRVGSSV